jgi:hypothetical protein
LGLPIASSQIYRLTNHYGQAIEADLDQAAAFPQPPQGIVYAQVDGAMLLTDEGYKENKLARIFKATALKQSPVADRGGHIASSIYTAHLGTAMDFTTKFRVQLDVYKPLGTDRAAPLVFISDGAIWLRQLMATHYPQATLILDLYHVMSYIGQVGVAIYSGDTGRF